MTDTDNESLSPRVDRRTVVAGSAWAVPAILYIGATPAMAASAPCVSDPAAYSTRVQTTLTLPPDAVYTTIGGTPSYTFAPTTLTLTSTIVYDGPEVLPAGAAFWVGFTPHPDRTVTGVSFSLTGTGAPYAVLASSSATGWVAYRQWTTTAPIPAGTRFTITWRVSVSASRTDPYADASGTYGVTTFIPPSGVCGTMTLPKTSAAMQSGIATNQTKGPVVWVSPKYQA